MLFNQDERGIRQKNKVIFTFFIFFTAATCIIRLFMTRFEIDPHSNLYGDSEFPVALFDYSIAFVLIATCISSKLIYKCKLWSPESKKNDIFFESTNNFVQGSQTLVFTSSLTGFMLSASSAVQFYNFVVAFSSSNTRFSSYLTAYVKENTFDFILFFVAILSAIYFFRTASLNPSEADMDTGVDTGTEANKKSGNKNTRDEKATKSQNRQYFSQGYMIFSFFPIIWSFLNIFKCFFDMSKSVNSPIRIYELVCFLSISLYFVAESRMLVGRRETAKFLTFAYTTVLLISLSAVPNIILSAFWILETSVSLIVYAVQVSFLLYIGSRVYSQIKYGEFILVKIESTEIPEIKAKNAKTKKSAVNK